MGMTCPMCNRNGCDKPADGVVAIEFYPPSALMQHYGTTAWLTQMVIGLELCAEHAAEVVPSRLLGQNLLALSREVEEATGTRVDIDACRAVLLAFDHPDVLRLQCEAAA